MGDTWDTKEVYDYTIDDALEAWREFECGTIADEMLKSFQYELAALRADRDELRMLRGYVRNGATVELLCRELKISGQEAEVELRSVRTKAERWELLVENLYLLKAGEPAIGTDEQVTDTIAALMSLGVIADHQANALRDAKAAAWDRVVVAFDKPSEWFKANFWAKCRDIINDFRKSHSTWPRGAASKEGKDDA